MGRKCQVTGKKPRVGNKVARRGIAKKKKGIGLNITGISRRRFLPNLFTKRLWFSEENRFVSLKLTAAALRTIEKKGLLAVINKMRKEGQKI